MGIIRLLSDPAVQAMVVEHRDRSDVTLAVAPALMTLRRHEVTPLLCVQIERASPTIFRR